MAIHHGEYTSAHVAGQQSRDEARTAASKAAEKTRLAEEVKARADAAAERAKTATIVTQNKKARRAADRMKVGHDAFVKFIRMGYSEMQAEVGENNALKDFDARNPE